MKAVMKHPIDDLVAFISGTFGGGVYMVIANITWADIVQNLLQLVWVGFVALFTGAMGVLGKHIVSKYLNRKNKKS